MSDTVNTSSPLTMPAAGMSLTTPTGLQSIAELTRRRRIVFGLNIATYLAMLWVAARILAAAVGRRSMSSCSYASYSARRGRCWASGIR
jgi:hypothetical protein